MLCAVVHALGLVMVALGASLLPSSAGEDWTTDPGTTQCPLDTVSTYWNGINHGLDLASLGSRGEGSALPTLIPPFHHFALMNPTFPVSHPFLLGQPPYKELL